MSDCRIRAHDGNPVHDLPEVVVFGLRDGELAEVARASGDEMLALDEPFPISLRPADLLR
jgi:hypothetical protein